MFDIAFSELIVVALVALIVIGPERLPKLARTAGHLWGRVQRYVTTVKNDISNEIDLETARKLQNNIQQHVAEVERSMQENGLTLEQSILQSQHRKSAPEEQGVPPAPSDNQPK
jgi:sec-independent protein translocase protein TatB